MVESNKAATLFLYVAFSMYKYNIYISRLLLRDAPLKVQFLLAYYT